MKFGTDLTNSTTNLWKTKISVSKIPGSLNLKFTFQFDHSNIYIFIYYSYFHVYDDCIRLTSSSLSLFFASLPLEIPLLRMLPQPFSPVRNSPWSRPLFSKPCPIFLIIAYILLSRQSHFCEFLSDIYHNFVGHDFFLIIGKLDLLYIWKVGFYHCKTNLPQVLT